ncbi:uncharacterized protein [Temnothorax longispinosus]|uniref:uncharacterized protein n=1 Tax=Temnothorax longispinosus TaxID=300112 RepID=UPI003A99F0DD
MDAAKATRKSARRLFTRTANDIDDLLSAEEPDCGELQDSLTRLEQLLEEIRSYDLTVKQHILETVPIDEAALDTEQTGIDNYEKRYLKTRRRVRNITNDGESSKTSVNSVMDNRSNANLELRRMKTYKLPKYEPRKFNGDVKEWLLFWSQFKKIHEDEDLDNADKFQYLVQCMVEGTKAADLVATFPQSGENYDKTAKALQERFGNEKVLKQVYIRELVKMVMANGSNQSVSLSSMFDKLSAHLQALETLGVNSDQMSTFLYPIVESTLPEEVLTAWQRSPNWGKDGSAMNPPQTDLQLLIDFLKLEVQCEDQRKLVRTGFQTQKKPQKKLTKNVAFQEEDGPTASGQFAGSTNKCLFCDKPHENQLCAKAASMNLENRKKVVTEKKACCLKHCVLLCPEVEKTRSLPESTPEQTPTQTTPAMSNLQCSGDVILQTVYVNLENNGMRRGVRLVFDGGCHRSYLLKSTAIKLGLKTVGTLNMCHILFGCSREVRQHQVYQVSIESLDGSVQTTLTLLDQEKICGLLLRASKHRVIEDLRDKKIFVNDIGEGLPEIEVLIGADNFASLLTGRKVNLRCGLIALETAYGWTLTGKLEEYESNSIREPDLHKPQAERDAEVRQHFLGTVNRNPDGKYCVRLPWIDESKQMPDNFEVAKKRLDGTWKKLQSMSMVEQYDRIFQDWILEGIVEVVPDEERNNRGHYLPHRPVVKPESLTTPIRPVFDASCKDGRAPSLNECLAKGPNLTELLPTVLNRFRCSNIGVSADIRKAFLMIEVATEDRDSLRVGPEDRKVAEKLLKSMYVDNALTAVNSVEELRRFKDATRLMAEAKMELRQWAWSAGELTGEGILVTGTNDVDLSSESYERERAHLTPVLDMMWDRREDEMWLEWKNQESLAVVSKRIILSVVSRVYDPIGVLCPVLLKPKKMLQRAWLAKKSWDEALEEELISEFKDLGIDGVLVQLIQAKARVTPIKKVYIHRLELFGCVIAVRQATNVKISLELEEVPTFYWIDSATALAWIRRNDQWGTLVGNRVKEILSCSNVENWRHVPGNLNPADLPSRGCTAKQLRVSRWWMGPAWLKNGPQDCLYPADCGLVQSAKEFQASLKFKQKKAEAVPGTLPHRVKDAMAFETTGVDLWGPLYLKSGAKVWIVLFTVLYTETVINQRPLTCITEDSEDLIPLTPAMFLCEISEVSVPDLDQLEKSGLRGRYRHLARIHSWQQETVSIL